MLSLWTAALLGAVLAQDPAEPWVLELEAEDIERREEAQRRLLELGPAARPALRKAAAEPDGERRIRARALLEEIERRLPEAEHDREEKARLLARFRSAEDQEREKRPGAAVGESVRFDIRAAPWKGGLRIRTTGVHYLRDPESGRREDLVFDVEVPGPEDRPLPLERCGVCSPGLVYLPDAQGPVKVRVRGRLLWFSRYRIEFKDPKEGDVRRLGDWTITVKWPKLDVESRREWPEDVIHRIGSTFDVEWRPGIRHRAGYGTIGGGGGGGGRIGSGKGWCDCRLGPQPVKDRPPAPTQRATTATQDLDPVLNFPLPGVEDAAKIVYLFSKPVEEPFDLSADVAPE